MVGKSSTGLSGWDEGGVGCVHLCRVEGNTVITYGKCHSVAVSWSSPLMAYGTFTFLPPPLRTAHVCVCL